MIQTKLKIEGGCLSKVSSLKLNEILEHAFSSVYGDHGSEHPMVIPQDCACIPSNSESLLVTVDMSPLVTNDYFAAGRISVLHSMSDIFASAGMPLWVLIELVVGCEESIEDIKKLMIGIIDACKSEGAEIVGGHTMYGLETMVGVTVIGKPRYDRILRKQGGIPGDQLFLSKPLGTGILMKSAAYSLADADVTCEVLQLMQASNSSSSIVAIKAGVHACTDISGFGLLGHLSEMLNNGLGVRLYFSSIPQIKGVGDVTYKLHQSGCMLENKLYIDKNIQTISTCSPETMLVLLDPQTNGGLLVAAPAESKVSLEENNFVWIGEITDLSKIEIIP